MSIMYVGKYQLKIEGNMEFILKRNLEEYKISGLLPIFETKEDAINFCGKDGYILLGRGE